MWNTTAPGTDLRLVALGLWLAIAAGLVWQATTVWQSNVTLWAHAVQEAPTKVRPRVNYAVALARAGRADEAHAEIAQAADLVVTAPMPAVDRAEAVWAIWAFREATRHGVTAVPEDGFVYEDRQVLGSVRPFAWAGTRPIARASLWLQDQAGATIGDYRLGNLCLHALVVLALSWVLRQWLVPDTAVLAGLAVFALQPVHVETLMTLSGRSELLAGVGVLLALVAVWRGWWLMGLSAGGLALASKETAIVALMLIPLVMTVRASHGTRRRWMAATLCGAVAVLALSLMYRRAGMFLGGELAWSTWLLVQSTAALRLCSLLVWPVGLTVDFDYDAVPRLAQLAAVVGLIGVAGVAWASRQVRPLVAVGLAWTLCAVLPRLIVQTPRSYLNEHQFYLPAMGVAFVVAGLMAPLEAR